MRIWVCVRKIFRLCLIINKKGVYFGTMHKLSNIGIIDMKKISILIDIIGYLFLFLILGFLFNTFFTMDYSVSAVPPLLRDNSDLVILKIRKILVVILNFFVTTTVDFMAVKKLLIKLKINKYEKIIFFLFLGLSIILFVMLVVFYNMYPL